MCLLHAVRNKSVLTGLEVWGIWGTGCHSQASWRVSETVFCFCDCHTSFLVEIFPVSFLWWFFSIHMNFQGEFVCQTLMKLQMVIHWWHQCLSTSSWQVNLLIWAYWTAWGRSAFGIYSLEFPSFQKLYFSSFLAFIVNCVSVKIQLAF